MKEKNLSKNEPRFLLALHSSTETLGIGLTDLNSQKPIFKKSTIKIGKDLSKYLFSSIERIFPSISWNQIAMLTVATGPGGFTGTRLTIVFARTIAQQLKCQIEGVSSFKLMAYRLIKKLNENEVEKPFWIKQNLKHRGIVAGKYKLMKNIEKKGILKIEELEKPHLIDQKTKMYPVVDASEDVSEDIERLLKIGLESYKNKNKNTWNEVLPIYPTSPVKIN